MSSNLLKATYTANISQLCCALDTTGWNMAKPIREMTGTTVRGPMNRMRNPMAPLEPSNTCVREAMTRLPEIYNIKTCRKVLETRYNTFLS